MASYLEISSLVKIAVAPSSWRILQSIDKTYSLEFRYQEKQPNGEQELYVPIVAQNQKTKIYKTEKALLKDIARVHQGKLITEAVIRFQPTQIG